MFINLGYSSGNYGFHHYTQQYNPSSSIGLLQERGLVGQVTDNCDSYSPFDDPWASQQRPLAQVAQRKHKPFLQKDELEHKVKSFKKRKSEVFHQQSGHKPALSKYQSALKKAILHTRKNGNGQGSYSHDDISDDNGQKSDTSASGATVDDPNMSIKDKNNSSSVQPDTEPTDGKPDNVKPPSDTKPDDAAKTEPKGTDETYLAMKDIYLKIQEEERQAEFKRKEAEEVEAKHQALEKINTARKQLEKEYGPMSDEQFRKIQERMGISTEYIECTSATSPPETPTSVQLKVKLDADSSLPNIPTTEVPSSPGSTSMAQGAEVPDPSDETVTVSGEVATLLKNPMVLTHLKQMATCTPSPSHSNAPRVFPVEIKKGTKVDGTQLNKVPEKGFKCVSGLEEMADTFTTEQMKKQWKDKGVNLKSLPKLKYASACMQLDFSKMSPNGKLAQEEQSTEYLLKLTSAKQDSIEKANEFSMSPRYASNVHKTLDHLGYTMLEPDDENQIVALSNSFFAIFGKAETDDKDAPPDVQADELRKQLINFISDNGSKFAQVSIGMVSTGKIKCLDISGNCLMLYSNGINPNEVVWLNKYNVEL